MPTEILALELQSSLLNDVVFGFAAGGDDGGALQGESFGQDLRTENTVGDEFGDLFKIRTQSLTPETAGNL